MLTFTRAIPALTILIAASLPATAAENLLKNGNLAVWKDGTPSEWLIRSQQSIKQAAGPEAGGSALRVDITKAVPGKSGEILQKFNVKPQTRYRFSGKIQGAAGVGILQIKLLDGNKELSRSTSKKNEGDKWTPVEISFDSGGANGVQALLRWSQDAEAVGKSIAFADLACEEQKPMVFSGAEVPPTAVATFNSLGLYWKPQGGSAQRPVAVNYRKKGADAWKNALPLWFDSNVHGEEAAQHTSEYRGSIVYLDAGTEYEVKLSLPGGVTRTLVAKTWDPNFKIARKVALPAAQKTSYEITEGGSAETGYVLYEAASNAGAAWDGGGEAEQNVAINASYVIVRGLTMKNAKAHGIKLGDVHHVVIDRCDISGWGRTRADGQAVNLDAAVFGSSGENENIVIQHCQLHHPRSDSNSWSQQQAGSKSFHPEGPQAIVLKGSRGGHVIRFNRIYSDMQHMFNDAMGETKNFSYRGFPGRDTDIHDNFVSHCWDDGLEIEGADMNVRVWNNYIDMTYGAIGAASPSLGPVYFFRNVYGVSRKHEGTSSNDYRGHYLIKLGNETATWVRGRMFIFHNTTLQPPPFEGSPDIGSGAQSGIAFTSPKKQAQNIISRNNILQMRMPKDWAIIDTQLTWNNDFDYDLYDGQTKFRAGSEAHGIIASPKFERAPDGRLWLAPKSPGHDAGERLPNFNDDYTGTAPDAGAVEHGDKSTKPPLWPAFPAPAVIRAAAPEPTPAGTKTP